MDKRTNKGRMILIAVVFFLICILLIGITRAEEVNIIDSGSCGENISWVLTDNGKLTISGTGLMTDYDWSQTAPWSDYKDVITFVEVGTGIESIGNCSFYELSSVKQVKLADSVTSIGQYAFYETAITEVNFPNQLQTIGDGGFSRCESLQTVSLPETVTAFGNFVFDGCIKLTSAVLSDNLESIGDYTFGQCEKLTDVTLPSNLKQFGYGTFYGCSSLKDINIPDGVTSLGSDTFAECVAIEEVNIPESVTGFGWGVFQNCKKLTSVTIPSSMTTLEGYCFYGCESLKTIVIPETVEQIGYYCFYGCTGFTDIQLPDGLQTISDGVFANCRNLTSFDIPSGVTSIGSYAFENCSKITNITLPEGITSVASRTFSGCSVLSDVVIPANVQTIGECAFMGCTGLTNVTIPEGVTVVGSGAYKNCDHLQTLLIPKSVTTIGTKILEECDGNPTIICYQGSKAETYAINNNYEYKLTGSIVLSTLSLSEDTILDSDLTIYNQLNFNGYNLTVNGNMNYSQLLQLDGEELIVKGDLATGGIGITSNQAKLQVDGDLFIKNSYSGNNLNGNITIGGNFYQEKGKFVIGDCTLDIGKNYWIASIEKKSDGEYSVTGESYAGQLVMTSPQCKINVNGDLVYWGSTASELTDGTIRIGGNLSQKGTNYNNSFGSGGNHKIIFGGNETQHVTLDRTSQFANMEVENKISFDSAVRITNLTLQKGNKISFAQPTSCSVSTININESLSDVEFASGIPSTTLKVNGKIYNDTAVFPNCIQKMAKGQTGSLSIAHPNMTSSQNVTITDSRTGAQSVYAGNSTWIQHTFAVPADAAAGSYTLSIKFDDGRTYSSRYNVYDSTEEYEDKTTALDSFMIERVKDYTSDYINSRYQKIVNDDTLSSEAQFQQVNDFFHFMGMTDYREGIDYISDTADERRAYTALTTNENWCASNYKSALNTNFGMRAALYTSGLIFNMEWTDYLEPSTYYTSETPGVKKYKQMLLDYLNENQEKNELTSFIKATDKLLSNGKNGLSAAEYSQAVIELQKLSSFGGDLSKAEIVGVFKKYTIGKVDSQTGQIKINTKNTEFNDYFSGLDKETIGKNGLSVMDGVSLIATTADDLEFILEVCSQAELSEENRAFLDEIINSDFFPDDMRIAAAQVKKQYDEQVNAVLTKLTADFIDVAWDFFKTAIKVNDWVVSTKITWQIGKFSIAEGQLTVGSLGQATATLSLATWITNQFIDVGGLGQDEAAVEAYAYLAEYYVTKLRDAKGNFVLDPSAENAWDFYNAYTMVQDLRVKGEEAYLKMQNVEGIGGLLFQNNYKAAYEVASRNISDCAIYYEFDFSHIEHSTTGKQYAKKAIIKCPVSVSVYDQNNQLIATIEDGSESDVTNDYGRFISYYDAFTGDYKKIVYLENDEDYQISCNGTTSGLVSAVLSEADNESVKKINNVSVEKNATLNFSTDQTETTAEYYENGSSEPNIVNMQTVEGDEKVQVTNITVKSSALALEPGASEILEIDIAPSNATNQDVIWKTTNPEVAVVSNGNVVGVSDGTAVITATTEDGGYTDSCTVTVTENNCATLYGRTLSLEGNIVINYYMELDSAFDFDTLGMKFWTKGNSDNSTIDVFDASEYYTDSSTGKTYYRFSYDVTAKEMGDTICSQMVIKNGDEWIANGEVMEYSAQTYASNQLKKSNLDADLGALLKSMLNYGSCAQKYFSYNTSTLANNILTQADQTISTDVTLDSEYASATSEAPDDAKATFSGNTLILDSATSVRFYYSLAKGVSANDLLFRYNIKGESETVTLPLQYSDIHKLYYASIDNIAAQDLNIMYEP